MTDEEIDQLKRKVDIKDGYCRLIVDLGADYDGWDTVDSLKSLIDNLVDYAKRAVKNDDKYAVYEGVNDTKYNILCEKLKEEETNED
ncbi:MAG: hypothetical protein ACI4U9_03295 [Clostridia bacterium]